jgi:aromatic-L-amino-acid/L-tryptophan decarboxylase
VEQSENLALVTPPSLALSVFRVQPTGSHPEDLNSLNRQFFNRISTRTDIYLTQTVLNGSTCTRFAVGSALTTREHILHAFEIISEEAKVVLSKWTPLGEPESSSTQ